MNALYMKFEHIIYPISLALEHLTVAADRWTDDERRQYPRASTPWKPIQTVRE